MKEIKYKKGWKKELRYLWDDVKLRCMDSSGWNISTREKKAREHNLSKDYNLSFCFRGAVKSDNGLYHVVGDIYYDEYDMWTRCEEIK